jgi:hypothetical protein
MQHTVTEEEARERWCPFARSYDLLNCDGDAEYRPVTINRRRGGALDIDCRCIASECMAWRSIGERYDPTKGHYTAHGFCGLVGWIHA